MMMILKLVGIKYSRFLNKLSQQDADEFFQVVMAMASDDAECTYRSSNLSSNHNPLFTTSAALWFLLHDHHPYDMMFESTNQNQDSTFKEEKKDHNEFSSLKTLPEVSYPRSTQILLSSSLPSLTGWMGSVLKCATCQHTKPIQNTPFYELSVRPSSSTIHQCLQEFFNTECVDDVECHNCTMQAQIETHQQELESLNRVIKRRQQRYGLHQSHQYDGLLQECQSCEEHIHNLKSLDPDIDDNLIEKHNTLVNKSHAYKSLKISRLPPVLILHVQRNDYSAQLSTMVKSNKHVSFPQVLDISPFLATSTRDKTLYQLQSVVEHIGNASSGHYQTFRRCSKKNKWIRCSDETTEYVTWDCVKMVQAYMLFYEAL